jgi:hypothetical protein
MNCYYGWFGSEKLLGPSLNGGSYCTSAWPVYEIS